EDLTRTSSGRIERGDPKDFTTTLQHADIFEPPEQRQFGLSAEILRRRGEFLIPGTPPPCPVPAKCQISGKIHFDVQSVEKAPTGRLDRNGMQEDFAGTPGLRSEEHTSELQSRENLVCR